MGTREKTLRADVSVSKAHISLSAGRTRKKLLICFLARFFIEKAYKEFEKGKIVLKREFKESWQLVNLGNSGGTSRHKVGGGV